MLNSAEGTFTGFWAPMFFKVTEAHLWGARDLDVRCDSTSIAAPLPAETGEVKGRVTTAQPRKAIYHDATNPLCRPSRSYM